MNNNENMKKKCEKKQKRVEISKNNLNICYNVNSL